MARGVIDMMDDIEIRNEAAAQRDYVIGCRRAIHRFAETSGREVRTSAFIKQQLDEIGIPYESLVKTGIIGILDTGRAGPHFALRADIDALPLPENPDNLKRARVVISDTPDETCHACGHDAHTAMLLGASKVLRKHIGELTGVIYLCFEEGEENGGGIQVMLDTLATKKVDSCWGIHVYNALESGKICVQAGPRMAGAIRVELTFVGRGGHGSRPDLSINPVFCAANFVNNLAVAFVNQIDANETVTCGITAIQGGQVANVIPDTATVLGSLRFFSMSEGDKAVRILHEVAENTARMHRCSVEYNEKYNKISVGPTINDPYYSELAAKALDAVLPSGTVSPCAPWYASDSFSLWLNRYPGVYAHLGINNPEYGSGAPHHNSYFDVDENVLDIGLIATLKYVNALGEEATPGQASKEKA